MPQLTAQTASPATTAISQDRDEPRATSSSASAKDAPAIHPLTNSLTRVIKLVNHSSNPASATE